MSILQRPWMRLALVLLFAAILLAPVRIPYRVLWLAAAALAVTWAEARSLGPLGLRRVALWPTLGWALGLFLFAAVAVGEVIEPMIEHALGQPADYSGYGALAGNLPAAARLFGFALISAAIGEEIVCRGFLLSQLERLFGPGDGARWAAIVIAGGVFALAHLKQGASGVIAIALIGLAMGWAWFRSGRNLWALIGAHALTDAYGIGMIYFGRYS
jgi:membrane protease YdiL (CAAX protease family)